VEVVAAVAALLELVVQVDMVLLYFDINRHKYSKKSYVTTSFIR
jgi:hypothetical protein